MYISEKIVTLIVTGIMGILTMIFLFLTSELEMQRNNAFIRRYPPHPITKVVEFDLGYNSYYIAGITGDSIYLGNFTAPLHLLAIDRLLKDSLRHSLKLKDMNKHHFKAVKINVLNKYYYISDGRVPIIYRGKLGDWQADVLMEDKAYFSKIVPVDKNSFVIKVRSDLTNENELGLLNFKDAFVNLKPEILEKQIEGIFDTDGMLLFNLDLNKVIYVYRYRNQFIVLNEELQIDYKGKTIDTITYAQLNIIKNTSGNQLKLGPNSVTVTQNAATSGAYLFLNSDRLGKYEEERMLSQSSIIDVYNLRNSSYEFSFYLYDFQKYKMREFIVQDKNLYMLAGSHLIRYELDSNYFNKIEPKNISADIRRKTENLK